jgi:hypothetical protein
VPWKMFSSNFMIFTNKVLAPYTTFPIYIKNNLGIETMISKCYILNIELLSYYFKIICQDHQNSNITILFNLLLLLLLFFVEIATLKGFIELQFEIPFFFVKSFCKIKKICGWLKNCHQFHLISFKFFQNI